MRIFLAFGIVLAITTLQIESAGEFEEKLVNNFDFK
jgi:hypothetical protein